MTIAGGLAVYFVIWWTVLFAVLPFGVQSQAEAGEVADGTDPGAPVLPGLVKKALITSVIAAIVFAGVWYIWAVLEL
jgi:predicted secreted protein